MHESDFSPVTVATVMRRRGRLHTYESLEPRRTALVVIDMQSAFLDEGAAAEIPAARAIIPNINRLAGAVRTAGGAVAWSQATFDPGKPSGGWSTFMDNVLSADLARRVIADLAEGAEGWKLSSKLEVKREDYVFPKRRFSAFTRGSSELEAWLQSHNVDTLLITGTLTNVCCESTARDAIQLGFRTVMIADGNATRDDTGHRATLNIFLQSFGDVRSTDETIALLQAGAARDMRAAE